MRAGASTPDGAGLAFDFGDLWYIKTRGRDDKRPLETWGGYSQDFGTADTVYSHEEVVASPHDHWAVVDCKDRGHTTLSTLIFDLDIHKAPDDFDPDDISVPGNTPIVKSQNGGVHVYFLVHADRGAFTESDFEMTHDLGWDIDIRGSGVSAHVVAPADVPGVDTPYEVVNDDRVTAVFDPADAAERIRYNGEALLEFNPDRDYGGSVSIDRDVEPPAEMPTCYHRGLQLRAASPDDHPNTHKVNVLTAMCGLAAGYSVETMVEHFYNDFGPDGADWEKTEYQLSHIADKIDRGEYAPPTISTLRSYGILDESETCECGIAYHGSDAASDSHTQWGIETCDPPVVDTDAFDAEDHWAHLQGERYDATIDADGPAIWADPAGSGKTTNAQLGAWDRDRPAAVLFDKHEKAREALTDNALPEGWDATHLKGGEQKRDPVCMDADHADEPCPDHPGGACPSMCPIYDHAPDADIRQQYEAVAREVGDVRAHLLFGEDLPGHDEDGGCVWLRQFDDVETAEYVVGVHEYQTLTTVTDGRDVITDETPGTLCQTRRVDVEGLTRTANALDDLADVLQRDAAAKYTAANLATFVRDLVDALTTPDADGMASVDPPTIVWDTYESHDAAAGHYVERVTPAEGEDWQVAEGLAKLKIAYNETILSRIKRDEWTGAPLCMDAILTAAAEAGLPTAAVMQAVAIPSLLEQCPWCGADLTAAHGARCCGSDTCDWHEATHTLIHQGAEEARAQARLDADPEYGSAVALEYEYLPLESELPDDPLILDATAMPSKVASLYGVDESEVTVFGTAEFDATMRVTQVLDGQYHADTITKAVDEDRSLADRIQRTIDTAGDIHESPLFVVKQGLIEAFDFPENGEVLHYHATRGLNRAECDAVVCIGAPHLKVDDLRREAALLAMGCDGVRVGGAEHSTRRDDDGTLAANPPVYRKLRYEDDDGRGRAVPTKHYTGLVGDLFREARENELEQAVHRARPLLAETPVDVYLLTNVPTDLPVDEVCSFSELADPLEAMLPVPEGAVDLLTAVHDTIAGDGPDGFRAGELVERRDDGTVANKVAGYHRLARLAGLDVTQRTVYDWVHALEDVGLLQPEGYEQRAGVSYAADPATLKSALSVLSNNGGFKAAATRRLRALASKSASGLDWLAWARDVFSLHGSDSAATTTANGGGQASYDTV